MAMSRFAKDLLNRIEILEACVDSLDERLREMKREMKREEKEEKENGNEQKTA